MESPPPSFDAIFEQQQQQQQQQRYSSHQRQSSTSSLSSNHFIPDFPTGHLISDEPHVIDRRASNGSLYSAAGRQRTDSGTSLMYQQQQQHHRLSSGEGRQDSIPFQSTLINTATTKGQGGSGQAGTSGHGQTQRQDQSAYYNGLNGQYAPQTPFDTGSWQSTNGNSYDQYQNIDNGLNQYNTPSMGYTSPYMSHSTPSGSGYNGDTPASMGMDMNSIIHGHGGDMMNGGYTGQNDWTEGLFGAGGSYQNGLGSIGDQAGQGEVQVKQEDALDELLRTISRAASREPSPQPQADSFFLQQQVNALHSFTSGPAYDSNRNSRSPSPFPTISNAPSPSFSTANIPRPGSSPSYNKPVSPPALVMPNNAPSPALPHIVTQPTQPISQGQGHALANQMGGMGGLLPPTNPALQHLTGMMGISPIAPNADGPQIFVQPSTPISGLKDGRGHFDAALRRAAQLGNSQQGNGQLPNHGQSVNQQQPQYTVPGPNPGTGGQQNHPLDFATQMQMQNASGWADLGGSLNQMRPRSKSDSFAPVSGGSGLGQADFERQAMAQIMAQAAAMGLDISDQGNRGQEQNQNHFVPRNDDSGDWRDNVGAWLNSIGMGSTAQSTGVPPGTVNPNQLPGNDSTNFLQQLQQQHQLSQLQAQAQLQSHKPKPSPLSVNTQPTATGTDSGIFKYEPGEFSPTSLAFYQQRGMFPGFGYGTVSAPYFNTTFQQQQHQQPLPTAPISSEMGYLSTDNVDPLGSAGRRRSVTEGAPMHHATGAGTPGYGVGFQYGSASGSGSGQKVSPFGTLDPSRMRSVSPGQGHRRAAKSEDSGRGGWGLGQGGSTTEFLNSITANDGSLIPPLRGRTHSRHSSASSARSVSPALSASSHGSSFSHASGSGRMDLPDGTHFISPGNSPRPVNATPRGKGKVTKMKVTSMATEVAATSRRTNSGIFQCPIPGCGSTFTRHFNLKGHMRSHNDERPYKCLYDGCPKAEVGFARQHDCKRHMLLHQGLRPFECEGCNKKFARLDALTRHHKSEQGQECAMAFPLPTNPDGSAMSESQYKAYRAANDLLNPNPGTGKGFRSRASSFGSQTAGSGMSGDESGMEAVGAGMEDYDRI